MVNIRKECKRKTFNCRYLLKYGLINNKMNTIFWNQIMFLGQIIFGFSDFLWEKSGNSIKWLIMPSPSNFIVETHINSSDLTIGYILIF